MKWLFLAFLIGLTPVLASWLRSSPAKATWIWTSLTLLPFVQGSWHLVIAPYSTPLWAGVAKGWEFSLLDCVALAVCFGTKGAWPRLHGLAAFLLYLAACLIAWFQAPFGALAFSYIVQLTRALILFLAIARVAHAPRGDHALIRGLVYGLVIQAVYSINAKVGGAIQTGGSFEHQNLLGFISHAALMPIFAVFLSGRWPKLTLIGLLSGLVCVAFTASRGAVLLSGFGLGLILILSLLRGVSGRKLAVGVVGALLLTAFVPLVKANLNQRFAARGGQGLLEEDQERVAFTNAAMSMISDYPMGVGPNHYAFIANTRGYNDRAGVYWGIGSRSASVHNSYLLVTAETGFLGIFTFIVLIASTIFRAVQGAFRFKKAVGGELLLGVAIALVVTGIHAQFEYLYLVDPSLYLLAVMAGITAGLRSRLARSQKYLIASPPGSQAAQDSEVSAAGKSANAFG